MAANHFDMDTQKTNYLPWIIGGVVIIAALIFLAVFLWPSAPNQQGVQTPTLPNASSTDTGAGGGSAQPMVVSGKLGPVTIPDFVHDGATAVDPQNPGTYYLAGSPCVGASYPGCPEGVPETDFSIAYDERPQFFTITLLTEPIGKARTEAEQFLESKFGLTTSQLCTLNYYVGTTYYVNQQFSGRNLGLSFCPNATVLPQ